MIVAAGQAAAAAGDCPANVAAAVRLVRQAGDRGARVLVLPEAFLTGYDLPTFAGDLPTDDDVQGPLLDPLREAATRAGTTVVLGAALQRPHGRRLSSVVVRPGGRTDVPYDKQHLDADERPFFGAGDHGTTIEVDGVPLALSTCYDGSFPEHARAAADDGALGYLCSVAYFPGGGHRRDTFYAARALDNGFYVVLAAATGRCGENTFIGGSAVLDPEGRVLDRLDGEEGVVVADLDPDVVAATRARFPMLADRPATLGGRVRA